MSVVERPLMNARVACPGCLNRVFVTENGACPECGRQLVSTVPVRPPLQGRFSKRFVTRGHPIMMSTDQVEEAYRWYVDHGLSLRRCADRLWPDTGYASAKSCANALAEQWRIRDWPLRDRIAATVTASYRHGLLSSDSSRRSKAKVREQRLARGEIRGVHCAGVKTTAPGRGRPCQRPALAGGDYCRNHDPDLAAERDAHMAAMRAKAASSEVGKPEHHPTKGAA